MISLIYLQTFRSLKRITEKCQKISQRSLLSRLITKELDKEDITECKEDLQHAIRTFNVCRQSLLSLFFPYS
jgi:hypothetical protein